LTVEKSAEMMKNMSQMIEFAFNWSLSMMEECLSIQGIKSCSVLYCCVVVVVLCSDIVTSVQSCNLAILIIPPNGTGSFMYHFISISS
jgi:hypothetical protein